ncbi:hypothetical protein D3C78_1266730 [compost metagenome]
MLGQHLQFTVEPGIQVATAVSTKREGFLQFTVDLQCHLPILSIDLGQLQLAFDLQRPIALRLQQPLQAQAQVITLQLQAVDLQARDGPMGCQVQLTQLLITIQAQVTDTHLTQLNRQRQLQRRQLQRTTLGFRLTRRESQVDLICLQTFDAQGHAQQAMRRPIEPRCYHLDPILTLLP